MKWKISIREIHLRGAASPGQDSSVAETAGSSGTAYRVAVRHPDFQEPEHQQVLVFPRIESVLAVSLPPQRGEV